MQVLSQTHSGDPEEKAAFVLTASALQKWLLVSEEETDRMFYSCDVEELARTAFATTVWVSESVAKNS